MELETRAMPNEDTHSLFGFDAPAFIKYKNQIKAMDTRTLTVIMFMNLCKIFPSGGPCRAVGSLPLLVTCGTVHLTEVIEVSYANVRYRALKKGTQAYAFFVKRGFDT